MKIDARWILPLALGLAIALPSSALAQGQGNAYGHNKAKAKDHQQTQVIVLDDDRDEDDRDQNRRNRNDRQKIVLRDGNRTIILDDDDFVRFPVRNGNGPSFCRSGAGHPVFGLQWCLNKGYGIGRPGAWFLRDDDLFLRDQTRVYVLRDRADDADRAFWGAVVGQILAQVD
ncbi:MAG TPA: hypothetical protein VEY33_05100 [Gemmatimonadota bacterium]|nr:hypothetical protein [Gemmatimonadota bacterium]